MEVSGFTPRPGRFAPGNRSLRETHSQSGLFFFVVDERNLLSLQGFEPLARSASSIATIIAKWYMELPVDFKLFEVFIWNCILWRGWKRSLPRERGHRRWCY